MIYPINTKFVDFDRTFIYGYVYGVVNPASVKANIGLANNNIREVITWGATAGAISDTLLGILASTLDVETTAAANVFAGGYVMPRTNPYSDYRVISNTAYDDGRVSGEMDILIEDDGLTAIVAASVASCFLDRNPYTRLYSRWGGADEYERFMGVTLIAPTASTYQWIQSWGPVHMPSDEQIGTGTYEGTAFFAGDGSLLGPNGSRENQQIGHAIGDSDGGVTTWFVQLQIER